MTRVWVSRVALGLGWCALAAGVAGIVLYFVRWPWELPVLAASGATYLMLGAVFGLLLFLLAKGWRSAAVAGVAVAVVLWTQLPFFVSDGRAATGPELRVLQSNLLVGAADLSAVAREVRERRVDVLTLQELTPEAAERLTAELADELPYHYLEPGSFAGGSGIFSRYPLRDNVKYDGFWMANMSATVEHPRAGAVAVFVFHPPPPVVDFEVWGAEMRRIREILDGHSGPAVVGADFNATRDHSAFRDLIAGPFDDAAALAGAGLLPTYPTDKRWGPVLGIDHILVSGGTADEVSSVTIPRSDHRALYATLRLND
ncbi:endonuclease/exonuclease/phosphatase family protein [Nocardia puris]|uniref:Endonuclease/exonuclease/phosphatase (EEP) superfamily protein YafD n=1 Tax=Nocardia puris TaxID=208602 RepID=A0A366DM76_9NOCA|nr:endonuclease/exonuclease/phosphatase family protein [Nocardia puris]MBF6213074.1 endonuclease/exonuclease/phosphatase family protein [Nocardia puris]MBF6368064.1 endonuclease/exonuclease/phosphatase family protein [Nocardia puris]MBF6462698.1 endonuclease/exonuclease/phosphatase family protein [Nocardia puris]RBO90318.1 endonuclease/exonuclease/phosphatase (EEP) superfamily protein YafD [Nocardia puris]